jgi:polyisoprenoid-binding protein YceI
MGTFLGFILLSPSLSLGETAGLFSIRPEESRFTVKVRRAGLLKVFGHDHLVEVRRYRGDVRWMPDAEASSSVKLDIEAASLTVVGEEVSEEDKAKIQATMEAEVLEVDEFPSIRFESKDVKLRDNGKGEYRASVFGELTLHGVTQTVEIPLQISPDGDKLRARGEVKLKGSRFGIEPVSVAGGTVKTKDELELTFDLVAVRK